MIKYKAGGINGMANGMYFLSIILVIIVFSLTYALKRRKQHYHNGNRSYYEESNVSLSERDLYVLKLIKEDNILSLSELKAKAHTTEIEINRIISRLLRANSLPGYFINYRTKSLQLNIKQPRLSTPSNNVNTFIPKVRVCSGCGASDMVNNENQKCSYCGSSFIL